MGTPLDRKNTYADFCGERIYEMGKLFDLLLHPDELAAAIEV